MPAIRAFRAITLVLSWTAASFAAAAETPRKAATKKDALVAGSGVVITLRNGSKVEGVYHGDADGAIWVEVDGGEVGLEKSSIVRIVPAAGGTAEYKKRAAVLDAKDPEGWWKLSAWAENQGLHASAKVAARSALKIDPDHKQARKFLGYEKVKGRWHQGDDAHRAKGLVQFAGEWVPPEELDAAKGRARNDEKESNLKSMRLHKPARYSPDAPAAPAKPERPFSGWIDTGSGR